jgi:hypothetical protein
VVAIVGSFQTMCQSPRAAAGAFDTSFYLLQAIELLAGAVNLSLMALNIRDGLRMSGRLRAVAVRPPRQR